MDTFGTSFRVLLLLCGVAICLARSAEEVCPDLTFNSSCSSGTCASGGFAWNYTVPIIPAKPAGYSVEYVGNVQWDGQVVRSYYNTNSPSSCCNRCKSRTSCAYWQFVTRHPNGDSNICFFYPVAPPTCGGNLINNAGGKCLIPEPPVCPDLLKNNSCNTGSCASGGKSWNWTVPILPAKPKGYSENFIARVQWDGQVVRAYYNTESASQCCLACKQRTSCAYWQFVDAHPNGDGNICFHYPISPPLCSGTFPNRAGGKCKIPGVGGDPHLVGAHGTRFDFSGYPGKTFCLLTDKNLHINMNMAGYLDKRTESATVFEDGKAVRSWIRQLAIMWINEQSGSQHTLKLVARTSPEIKRGLGFLEYAEVDGEAIPRLEVGQSFESTDGLIFKLEGVEKNGPYDVDFYSVTVDGLLMMDVRLRVAHQLLREAQDAYAHFEVSIKDIKHTESIHGVLGQTFRNDRDERNLMFSGREFAADAESGKGFLDGATKDYISSGITAADCRYTTFEGHKFPSVVQVS